jgi:hypothetical protein
MALSTSRLQPTPSRSSRYPRRTLRQQLLPVSTSACTVSGGRRVATAGTWHASTSLSSNKCRSDVTSIAAAKLQQLSYSSRLLPMASSWPTPASGGSACHAVVRAAARNDARACPTAPAALQPEPLGSAIEPACYSYTSRPPWDADATRRSPLTSAAGPADCCAARRARCARLLALTHCSMA